MLGYIPEPVSLPYNHYYQAGRLHTYGIFPLFVMILLLAVLEVQHNESVSLIISPLSRAVIECPTSWL